MPRTDTCLCLVRHLVVTITDVRTLLVITEGEQ
jgi:hypothetical protein